MAPAASVAAMPAIKPASDEFLAKVDDWRRKQPDIPGLAEAMRRLVEIALGGKPKAIASIFPSKKPAKGRA
jgi:hypothetical protein